jgi:LmbE family N-acetylglucosaminyl deacetylase
MRKILVLAVHPDDETLGCGGTLLRHKKEGDEIFWLIATAMKKESNFSEKDIKTRKEEIGQVRDKYGFKEVYELDIPCTKADQVPRHDLTARISGIFDKARPEVVYLPFINDVHSDHRVIFEAAYSSTKTFRRPFIKKILMMETISETEFVPPFEDLPFTPNYFVDISDFLDKKLDIMKIYKNEHQEHPFPRSMDNIKALATFRGAAAGCRYAESFMVLKEIA